jgi:ubiquinone biosynthesis protein COQ9
MTILSDELRDRLLDAALVHVPFEGWSETTLRAAIRDAGVTREEARAVLPRGAVDLALAHHRRGDARMVARLRSENLDDMRFRDRIAAAVRYRIEAIDDREAARRATAFFALPTHTAEGARAIWETVDQIWTTLGDTSEDANWYTKRATLAGVYASTVLYWLGDDSLNHQDTWAFLERRIDDVMRIEKLKGAVREQPLLRPLLAGPNWLMSRIRAPRRARTDLPGGAGMEPARE